MKKISGLWMIIEGFLLIVGPYYIWGVCENNPDKNMVCRLSCNVEIVIGVLIILLGIFFISNKNTLFSRMFYISMNIFGILVPEMLVGSCKVATMRCNVITFPILYVICLISLIHGLGLVIKYLNRKKVNEDK